MFEDEVANGIEGWDGARVMRGGGWWERGYSVPKAVICDDWDPIENRPELRELLSSARQRRG